jgi:hypothetical protein
MSFSPASKSRRKIAGRLPDECIETKSVGQARETYKILSAWPGPESFERLRLAECPAVRQNTDLPWNQPHEFAVRPA